MDKACQYSSGKYEQFYIINEHEVKYNEEYWKSFSYTNDEGNFIAATLHRYAIIDLNGKVLSKVELDIQPYKNTFGKVLFVVGNDLQAQKLYILEGEKKSAQE